MGLRVWILSVFLDYGLWCFQINIGSLVVFAMIEDIDKWMNVDWIFSNRNKNGAGRWASGVGREWSWMEWNEESNLMCCCCSIVDYVRVWKDISRVLFGLMSDQTINRCQHQPTAAILGSIFSRSIRLGFFQNGTIFFCRFSIFFHSIFLFFIFGYFC